MSAQTENEQEQAAAEPAVSKKVSDALRRQGVRVADLDPEQRARAADPDGAHKGGLRGKALANWIVGGDAANQGEVDEDRRARQVERQAARERKAQEAGTPGKRASAYPAEVRQAVKISNGIRGKSHGGGPKQHQHIRAVVVGELGGQPGNGDALAALVGVSRAELTALADGSADRESLKALRPLAEKMGDDSWCKGRHLAAALAAWAQQLDAAS
jgi:hypothetical protein